MSERELTEPKKAFSSNKQRHSSLTKATLSSFVNNNSQCKLLKMIERKFVFTKKVAQFYHPTPAPETVTVHTVPKKTNDACCWGW